MTSAIGNSSRTQGVEEKVAIKVKEKQDAPKAPVKDEKKVEEKVAKVGDSFNVQA